MSKLYNHSKCIIESAKKVRCPRCSGYGGVVSDEGEICYICQGDGVVWISDSGYTRPMYGKIGNSEHLY